MQNYLTAKVAAVVKVLAETLEQVPLNGKPTMYCKPKNKFN